MHRRYLKTLWVLAICVAVLLLGGINAQAYLSPDYTNPDLAPGGATPFTIGPGDTPDYLTNPNWAYTPRLRKFIDLLPGLGADNANNLGQYIPVAVADTTSYPGSDYYEILLLEFEEQMHSDLPPTRLRGYVQVETAVVQGDHVPLRYPNGDPVRDAQGQALYGVTPPHFLGPMILSETDRPVRVKFINKLPTGAGGDLFIPVDTTIMGAGEFDINYDPVTKELTDQTVGSFTQNRGLLHLHGGRSPWISDGTPHQWITPAGEVTEYPTGVSMENVPDMPDPGPGAQTYYWTNQQSSRMMFYHDHAWGITRLNVYVGEAAGYLIRDETEQKLIDAGILPGKNPGEEIPLVFMDKSYVDADPDSPYYVLKTDPTWRWGTGPIIDTIQEGGKTVPVHAPKMGDLWWPHVYMPAQNPFDISGIAPMGRWAYGPYFWPPTNNPYQPVPNPYYSPDCDPAGDPLTTPGLLDGFCQPPEIPGTPNPSWGAEAFMDTPTVNGTAYPVLEVEPKAYRLRVLNAAHDRFWNLSMFVADSNPPVPANQPETLPNLADFLADGYDNFANNLAPNTEVRMLPATVHPGFPETWPADGREGGVPDYTMAGPAWVMIGSEGGFLPQPVVLPPHPVTWNNDVTTFNAGNVSGGSLILGPAERADVVVDFSDYAGQTLIVYNDAPAPWPAIDPHYDYYTGAPDNRPMGGADSTPIGFGPNTRTVMQIKVAATASTPNSYTLQALQTAFDPNHDPGYVFNSDGSDWLGAFRESQDPLIVGQGNMNPTGEPSLYEAFVHGDDYSALNTIYEKTFPTTYPNWGVSRIYDRTISIMNPTTSAVSQVTMKAKAIQDEQGETFDDYGRMRAALGLELTNPQAGQVNFIVQHYSDPATEILNEDEVQVWKITHNGVDTHPVHFHLYDVQVLNRVGWDGFIRLPDPTELGWKDTVRISPLEDTIVAIKPVTPRIPFGIPESVRPLNPARFLGDNTELSTVDPYTGEAWATPNLNRMYNFDWEYVWHCHILSHEENDMMRPQSFLFSEILPGAPSNLQAAGTPVGIRLTWLDPTPVNYVMQTNFGTKTNEIGFKILRAIPPSTDFVEIGRTLANATTFTDTTAAPGETFQYRVVAYNAEGDGPPSSSATATEPSVILTSPADGATFTAPAQINLAAQVAGGIVRVDFYQGPNLLMSDTEAPFEATWSNVPAGAYTLRARGFTAEGQAFNSDPVGVTVASAKPVLVLDPNGNEEITGGTSYLIRWASSQNATQFHVRYDDGTGWKLIKAFVTGNSYNWAVPNVTVPTSARVHVTALDAAGNQLGYDVSDAPFTINPGAAPIVPVTVVAPNGGEQLTGGSTYNIEWSSSPEATQFHIRYDDGSGWKLIKAFATGNSYSWTVPNVTAPTTAKVQVSALDAAGNQLGYDASDAFFTIIPGTTPVAAVTVVAPNGGEQITGGATFLIEWTSRPDATQFHLRYDDGTGWKLIKAFATGNNWSWVVPNVTAPTSAKVQVTALDAAGNQLGYDASDGTFTINP